MKKENVVLAMVYALEVLVPVMLIFMVRVVNMLFALTIVANMVYVIWKLTAVSVMKDGQVGIFKLTVGKRHLNIFFTCI